MNTAPKNILPLLLILIFVTASPADSPIWPAWRGPLGTGIVPDGDPPVKWSETTNIRWKVELTGDGSNSTPIIWADKLYYQTAVKTDRQKPQVETEQPQEENQGRRRGQERAPSKNYYKFNLVCRDRHTGALVWSKTVTEATPHEGHHDHHGFVSYSPVTDGKLIWASFGSQGLYCFDMNGEEKWHVDLGPYYMRNRFGEGGSPALAGEYIIVAKDHEKQSSIFAFDKNTGEEVWKKDRDEESTWTTPFVVDYEGRLQVIMNGSKFVRSYDVTNGDLLWKCSGQFSGIVPTPVLGFNMVFCTSGHRGHKLQAIRLGRTGDLSGTDAIAWEHDEATTPYVPSPLLYGDKLYVCYRNTNLVSCYNAQTGKPYYTKQKLDEINGIYASPIGVAGRVYWVGRNGVTYVLKNAEQLEVLAVNKLDDGIDCSPVVIGDTLYLKGKTHLYCVQAD